MDPTKLQVQGFYARVILQFHNGDTYEFCLDKYFPKISQGGIIILEGGSKERDEVDWMNKFNFPKIRPVIEKIEHNTLTLEAFPSLTIIKK